MYFLLHFLAGWIFWLLFSCSYFPSAFLILETDQEICQFTCWITYFRLNFNLVYLVLSSLCSLNHNPGPDDQLTKKVSILYAVSSCVFVFPTQKILKFNATLLVDVLYYCQSYGILTQKAITKAYILKYSSYISSIIPKVAGLTLSFWDIFSWNL